MQYNAVLNGHAQTGHLQNKVAIRYKLLQAYDHQVSKTKHHFKRVRVSTHRSVMVHQR